MPKIIPVDDIQISVEGRLFKLKELTTKQLWKIYENHKKLCTIEDLDLVLGCDDPIPPDDYHLHVLRRVDRILIHRNLETEEKTLGKLIFC